MASIKDSSRKKAYHSPRLRVYGTVEELTQSTDVKGAKFDTSYITDPKTG